MNSSAAVNITAATAELWHEHTHLVFRATQKKNCDQSVYSTSFDSSADGPKGMAIC